jgi:hypothetical protein
MVQHNSMRNSGITVSQLIAQLNGMHPNAELYFGGLTFLQVKSRTKDLVQIEFNENCLDGPNGEIIFYPLT